MTLKNEVEKLLDLIGELAITHQKFIQLYAGAIRPEKWDKADIISRILYQADEVKKAL